MITKKDIEHISNLARTEITHKEKKELENSLSAILEFVEKLNELDTKNVLPMTGGTMQKNAMRDDTQVSSALEGKAAELIRAIPEKKDERAKVKSVFEQSEVE